MIQVYNSGADRREEEAEDARVCAQELKRLQGKADATMTIFEYDSN